MFTKILIANRGEIACRVAATAKRGLAAGIHCGSTKYAKRAIGMGFKLVTIGSDATFIAQGAKATVTEMRAR